MSGEQGTLFDAPAQFQPFTVYGQGFRNYMRERMGQNNKICLRSRERKGKIVATLYVSADDAAFVVDAINYYAAHYREIMDDGQPKAN